MQFKLTYISKSDHGWLPPQGEVLNVTDLASNLLVHGSIHVEQDKF